MFQKGFWWFIAKRGPDAFAALGAFNCLIMPEEIEWDFAKLGWELMDFGEVDFLGDLLLAALGAGMTFAPFTPIWRRS